MCTTLISAMRNIVLLFIAASLLTCAASKTTDADEQAQIELLTLMREIQKVSNIKMLAEMASVSVDNQVSNNNTSTSAHNSSSIKQYEAIYPGTKWCGAGNISTGYNDLGTFRKEDICCRAHDYCTPQLYSFTTSEKLGISNMTPISKLECSCDTSFYKCLKAVGSVVASTLGNIYFNVLGNQCFRKDYPTTGCKTYYPKSLLRCKVYNYNTKGKKIYQYFDAAIY